MIDCGPMMYFGQMIRCGDMIDCGPMMYFGQMIHCGDMIDDVFCGDMIDLDKCWVKFVTFLEHSFSMFSFQDASGLAARTSKMEQRCHQAEVKWKESEKALGVARHSLSQLEEIAKANTTRLRTPVS